MRIAFITETFLPATDGVVTRLRYTMEELARMGDEMLVVAPRYGEGPRTYAGAYIHRVAGVPFPVYPQIMLAPPNPGVGAALREFGPDLIHAVNPFILGAGAPRYAKTLGVPLVASYHTNVAAYAAFYKLGPFERATRWYTRKVHNAADLNLCTSQTTLKYLAADGVERLRLWPQGVDAKRLNPTRATHRWREKLTDDHPDEKILLFVGRLAREKGIERLKAILDEVPGVRLALVGDGPARREIERGFAGTPTAFTGFLRGGDLARAYASADAFIFPSTTETLGLSMLEAMAAGLPVIAARSGASHEIVSDGETGFLYDPRSRPELVGAVRRIFTDDGLRKEMGRKARAIAEGRDWESATRTMRGYYGELVS